MKWKRILSVTAGVIVLAGAAALQITRSVAGSDEPAEKKPRVVRVEEVTSEEAGRTARMSGMTRAASQATLSFTIPGRIEKLDLEVGSRVEEGQVLAVLDRKPLKNAVAGAQAQLASLDAQLGQASQDLERYASLHEEQAVTQQQLEQADSATKALGAGKKAASAQFREAKRQLSETKLVAPFDGVVTETFLEAGEFTGPGVPVIVLTSENEVEVEVEVPESMLEGIEEGDGVLVDLPFAGMSGLSGAVRSVGRASVLPGRLFPVVVAIDQVDGVLPGMTAEVRLNLESEEAITVPIAAVVNPSGERAFVYRIVDGVVEKVDVEVDGQVEGRVVVRGDLAEGDQVVVSGQLGLLDGERVEVL